jgi:secreted trypsin-like serine protease
MRTATCLLFAVCLGVAPPAQALIGETQDGAAYARHVAMVLRRGAHSAGFCSAVVVARRTLLTSAHCVGEAANMRIYATAPDGAALLEVARATRHPGYRADAIAARRASVDLAVVETRDDLPSTLAPVEWAPDASSAIDQAFIVAGFGVAQEALASSGGRLRAQRLLLRAPLSSLLLWLAAPTPPGGACEGDSGAPVFDAQGRLVALVAFAEGARGAHCGALTQAVRVAPFRAFVEARAPH